VGDVAQRTYKLGGGREGGGEARDGKEVSAYENG
jgi:hypothetical protein